VRKKVRKEEKKKEAKKDFKKKELKKKELKQPEVKKMEVKKEVKNDVKTKVKVEVKEEDIHAPAMPPSLASPLVLTGMKKTTLFSGRQRAAPPSREKKGPEIEGYCEHGYAVLKSTLRIDGEVCISILRERRGAYGWNSTSFLTAGTLTPRNVYDEGSPWAMAFLW
jgi:hypothetical protein